MRSDAIQSDLRVVTEIGDGMMIEPFVAEKTESVRGPRGRVDAAFWRARSRWPNAVAGVRGRFERMRFAVRRGIDAR